MKTENDIRKLISEGKIEEAISLSDELLQIQDIDHATIYYLKGNAHRKKGDWQQSLNNYQRAIDLDPENPAKQAYQMVMDILEFYHKDMYNQ